MKVRSFLKFTLAAAALVCATVSTAQTYKSEYRMSLVLGTAFPWGKGGEIWANLVKERTQGRINIKPVSYTHLDVYKRQVVHHLAASAVTGDCRARHRSVPAPGAPAMIATLLFCVFVVMMLLGVPIGASLGLAGAAAIALANADSQWFGLLAVPQNFYAGLGKYPLLAIPMFVLVGSIFDRSGVALRLVNFAVAIVGRGPGMLPVVVIAVAVFMGGISGSGPAPAADIGGVMIAAMTRSG